MRQRVILGIALTTGFLMACTGMALASEGTPVCIPTKEGKAIVTPIKGVCKTGYTLRELGAEGKEGPAGKTGAEGKPGPAGIEGKVGPEGGAGPEGKVGPVGPEGKTGPEGKSGPAGPEGTDTFTEEQLALLKSILPYVRYVAAGVGDKPTIQFSGANIQIVNGTNKENPNGTGNLVIGYDEHGNEYQQTGSHNIILGSRETYTRTGSIIGGYANTNEGTNNFIFGFGDKVGEESEGDALLGGDGNQIKEDTAQGTAFSVIVGGQANSVSNDASLVAGGIENTIEGREAFQSVILGGERNRSHAFHSSIVGGAANETKGEAYAADNTITGGAGNHIENASARLESTVFSMISGGENNFIKGSESSVVGGLEDQATGGSVALFGGYKDHSASAFAALVGGYNDAVTANYGSAFGGKEETASEEYGVK
jgi:hypothetical protein